MHGHRRTRLWRGAKPLRAAFVACTVALTTLAAPPVPAQAANRFTSAGWALDRLDQIERRHGQWYDDGKFRYHESVDGTGVTVFVLSTGVFNGTDLGGRVGSHRAFGGAKINDPVLETCLGAGGSSGTDGAALASLVAGTTYGVAKAATVNFLQLNGCTTEVYDCGYFPNPHCNTRQVQAAVQITDVIEAIAWVTANKTGPTVALLDYATLSGSLLTSVVESGIALSVQAGITWVVPAGDNTSSNCNRPAATGTATDGLITAGGTTASDAVAAGTSVTGVNGTVCADIYGPGANVDALSPLTGATRAAAAYTAGVIAQYLEPGYNWSPSQLEQHLKSQATTGKLTGVPANTPNLLLHSAWWGPVLQLDCVLTLPLPNDFDCTAYDLNGQSYDHRWRLISVSGPPNPQWSIQPMPSFDNSPTFTGYCQIYGQYLAVEVTSSKHNSLHSDTTAAGFTCSIPFVITLLS